MSLVEDPRYQSFMPVHNPDADLSWEEVKPKVLDYCCKKGKEEQERFVQLTLAFAKYELHGAPSNWKEHNHEEELFGWIAEIMEDAVGDEELQRDFEEMIRTLNQGFIPDCFSILNLLG